MKERREYSRTDFSGSVTFEACSSLESDTAAERQRGHGKVVNISDSGFCLVTLDDVKKTQILKINLPLPGISIQIPTLAMVMWMKPQDTGNKVGMMYVI